MSQSDRLAALRRSGLLDTDPEPAFDRLAELVRRLVDVPVALVSLVDGDRQFFKSQRGLAEPWASARETPISHSFCQHVVAADAPLVVGDARAHPLVCDNPAVEELGVVAYLGVPVRSPDGHALGSLCAIGPEPRTWTADDRAALEGLAALAETEIALRAEVAVRTRTEAQYRALFEASPDAVLVLDPVTETVLDANAPACALYGRSRDELVGSTMKGASGDDGPGEDAVARMLAEGGTERFESVHTRKDGTRFDVAISASVVRLGEREVVLSVNRDVSERNRADEAIRAGAVRAAFREALADALRPLTDPDDVQAAAARVLGEHLGASRVFYAGADPGGEALHVVRDYSRGGVATVVGTHVLDDFGPDVAAAIRAGRTLAVDDTAGDPAFSGSERAAYAALGIGSHVVVPLVKGGRLVGLLGVHEAEPRAWTAEEVAVAEEMAERTWAAVERARAEAAVRASGERFRQISEALPQLVWTARPDGCVDFFNTRWCDYTGQTPETWTWGAAAHPDDAAESRARWARSLATGESFEMELRLRRAADGAYRWFIGRAEPVRGEGGEIVQWFGTCTDVHDLHEARERLRASGERLRLVSRATDDVIWDWDAAADELTWSPAVLDMLGWEEALVGTELAWWEARVHPDDRSRVAQSFRETIQGGGAVWQEEYRFRRADGTYAFILDRGHVVRGPGGGVVRVVGAMLDLSERRAFEVQLVAAREEAEAAARLKSALLNNMSHEIRTPLTAILGFAAVLADEAPPDLRDYAEIIGRGGRRLLDTLNSVLDLAQIEGGELPVSPEPVDLYAEAGRACAQFGPLALGKGLDLRLVGEAACALADRQAVARVLDKLIGNAIKFTSHGAVTVEVRASDGQVRLRVADTGAGISAEFLSDLFDEFTQESEGHHRAYEGSGLGLAITKRLVGLMGGEIGVESEKGAGSAFTVVLPAASGPDADPNARRAAQGSPAGETARAA